MKPLDVPVRETPVGLVAVLPPMIHVEVLGLDWPVAVGDVLGVVTKCERCDGDGIDASHEAALFYAARGELSNCSPCDGTGYAPLKFIKVLDVWQIVTMSQACAEDAPHMPFVVTRGPGGLDVLAGWPDPAHETLLDLPDAEPGGVALHVEPTDCPDCGGTQWDIDVDADDDDIRIDVPCRCQTPFVPPSNAPLVEVKR